MTEVHKVTKEDSEKDSAIILSLEIYCFFQDRETSYCKVYHYLANLRLGMYRRF